MLSRVFHILPVNIKALNDVWLIGDVFLGEIINTLQNMKRAALFHRKKIPYVYEHFNVFHFTQSPLTLDTMACMQNAFIEACNRRMKLPHYVILFPDRDIIEAAGFFNFGVSKLLAICTNWLAKHIERGLESLREDIAGKRPGSVADFNTKIIWVKMLE